MSIFDIIVDAVDGFDEKFEDTLQFLNEKIEKAENKRNNKANRVSNRTYRKKRTSSKNTNTAEKIKKNNVLKYNDKKEEKEINQNKEIKIKIDIINKCKNKIKEIRELIKNFDYASRKSYESSCTDLERSLEYVKNAEELNKIIEYINNLYKSAYYKKHNKSSLSFMMDDDEELDFIKWGGINE